MTISGKHRATLLTIFADPVRANIAWRDIEALFVACGREVIEGNFSRVRVGLNGVRAVFHRPHPEKERDRGTVRSVRRFRAEAEVKP